MTPTWQKFAIEYRKWKMPKIKKTHDIFLSYPFDLNSQAKTVIDKFEKAGLAVFAIPEITPSQDILQQMWQALAESWAVVALLESETMTPSVAVEIGAAAAWNKPIYILTERKVLRFVDFDISRYGVYQISQIDKVIDLISKSLSPLNGKEKVALVKAYQELSIPTDQLLLEPTSIERLNKMIWQQSNLRLSGERVMQELLRLRKKGKLPKVRKIR